MRSASSGGVRPPKFIVPTRIAGGAPGRRFAVVSSFTPSALTSSAFTSGATPRSSRPRDEEREHVHDEPYEPQGARSPPPQPEAVHRRERRHHQRDEPAPARLAPEREPRGQRDVGGHPGGERKDERRGRRDILHGAKPSVAGAPRLWKTATPGGAATSRRAS